MRARPHRREDSAKPSSIARIAIVASALLLASGCATSADSSLTALSKAASASASASASALLAFELGESDAASASLVHTTWQDASTELLDAHRSATELEPTDAPGRRAQDETLQAIRAALDAIRLAQASPDTGSPRVEKSLRKATRILDGLRSKLAPYQ